MLKFREAFKQQTREVQRENMSSDDKKIASQKSNGPTKPASADPGELHLPRTPSSAKVAANRRNAQKSTGPKTAGGKDRSRWNAVKHGLLNKRLAFIDSEGNRAFVHLLASLSEDLRPQGALEEILVEKIAMGYWRLHVALGYEVNFARFHEVFLESIDRLSRYSTSIQRQLTQDMNQLERLQRQREGEFVPAPISVDMNINSVNSDQAVPLPHSEEVTVETSDLVGTANGLADQQDKNIFLPNEPTEGASRLIEWSSECDSRISSAASPP
jgi:hypothetical protein